MTINLLDPVILTADLPEHGLRRGDMGAVVEIYDGDSFEVEFVNAAGENQALVTLSSDQLRGLAPNDIPAVRGQDAA